MIGLRRRDSDDTGASLILALAFMTFLGLVVSALLTYGGTSLRSTNATQAKAESSYDIDGALQAAVNQVRTEGTFTNALGQSCPELSFPAPNATRNDPTAPDIKVICDGAANTGAAGGPVAINPANRPVNALLTLGSGPETGINKGDDNLLLVRGDVYVNGTATSIAQGGTACPVTPWPPAGGSDCSGMGVQGKLIARGDCNGRIVVSGVKRCNVPTPSPAGVDPVYSQPAGTLSYRPVPACGAGATVTFTPGYYDDAVALSSLTSGGCKKTMHFPPGIYFFDFHNGAGAPLPAGSHVWTIDDANTEVVGGMPQGWTPAGGNPSVPGACVSPLKSTVNGGVQFVFGGDSRLDVKAGKVELCGQYSPTSPPIAIYGARTGADPGETGPVTAKTDGTGTSTGPAFTTPEEIVEADSVPSEAVIAGGAGGVTSQLTLKEFKPPTLPAGSIITSAEFVVLHREQSAGGSTLTDLNLTFTPDRVGAAPTTRAVTPYLDGPAGGPFHETRLDVTSVLADEAHRHGLDGLRVKYAATVAAGKTVTERLDSVQLMLTWIPPAVRGQGVSVGGGPNCVGIPGAGGCPMIKSSPANTKLYVQGTLYAPLALADVELEGVSAPVFSVGIIVRALKIRLQAADAFGMGAMIDVPDHAPGGAVEPLEVYFRAYTCPEGQSAACTATPAPDGPWRLSGTARARYVDPDIFSPTPPYDAVIVLGWTVRST